jgi:hypothetical protein
MTPIFDWPQYGVLCLSTFLMGVLIGDFAIFLAMYLLGLLLSSVIIYFLICLPLYIGILPADLWYFYSRIFEEYALNYIAKSWIIAPFVLFLFAGVAGIFVREIMISD